MDITRRDLLSGAATIAAVALPTAALANGGEPDPHPAWLAQILNLRARVDAGDLTEEQADQLLDQKGELEDHLYEVQAWTLDGLRAQLAGAVAALDDGTFHHAIEGQGLRTALATLEQLAGRA